MQPGAAGAHFQRQDRRAGRIHVSRAADRFQPPRSDPGFRGEGGVVGLGRSGCPASPIGDAWPDRRVEVIDLGVGTFEWEFDHLQELVGKLADDVIAQRAEDNA